MARMGSENIGAVFQQMTKYFRSGERSMGRLPERAGGERFVALPAPFREDGPGLWETIARRRSVRDFSTEPMSTAALSSLLWACQGVTASGAGHEYRAAPSAGALYPVETYVIANRITGLEAGLYRYLPCWHALLGIAAGALGEGIARASLDQGMAEEAAAVFVWTAVFERCVRKYRQRAYRYVYLDAGHVVAHLTLAATALGLGSCPVAAVYDDEVNALLGVDGVAESVLYLAVVGRPAGF
ncbi:MAG: SagB/ThcOx family dehydrogenase [Planctomycetota bacterium]